MGLAVRDTTEVAQAVCFVFFFGREIDQFLFLYSGTKAYRY